jgi:hypothetical protein
MTRTASAAVGDPEHVACIAAQAGTAVGLGIGDGVGEGDGLGAGLVDGVEVGLAKGEADGLECANSGPFAAQAETASRTTMAATPPLTRD